MAESVPTYGGRLVDHMAQLRNSEDMHRRVIEKTIADAEAAGLKVTIIPPDEILIEKKEGTRHGM